MTTTAVTAATPPAFLRKYLAVARIAVRQRAAERVAVVGRVAFYAIILLVFSRLWQAVLEGGALGGIGAVECLWYLAVTEWVVLSQPAVYLDIERDVRSGDVAYHVGRPISYVGAKLAEALGDVAFRMALLGPVGAGLALAFAGDVPADPRGLLVALPLGVLAAVLVLLFHALIGLLAFWLQDVSPIYWVWQKLTFILGGLMLPLEIYPGWLRALALASPFSAMLHGPGRQAFGLDAEAAAFTVLRLVAWIAVATAALWLVYRRALRRLEVNGG